MFYAFVREWLLIVKQVVLAEDFVQEGLLFVKQATLAEELPVVSRSFDKGC